MTVLGSIRVQNQRGRVDGETNRTVRASGEEEHAACGRGDQQGLLLVL